MKPFLDVNKKSGSTITRTTFPQVNYVLSIILYVTTQLLLISYETRRTLKALGQCLSKVPALALPKNKCFHLNHSIQMQHMHME